MLNRIPQKILQDFYQRERKPKVTQKSKAVDTSEAEA
jgi:hypothetical protein